MNFLKLITLMFLTLLLTSCNQTSETNYELLTEKLEYPWEITKLDETFYITERPGFIVMYKDGTINREMITTKKEIVAAGEGGLLGLALLPDFQTSHQAFVYHTYQENDELKNRVIIIEQTTGGWKEISSIIENIPGATIHNGGRLKIRDHYLYITTGDASIGELAQNIHSLAGKILRVDLNGTIPKDNPFPNSLVYSYGHRNPQGLAWSKDGIMYASEHGPSGTPTTAHDEINIIEPGKNYGWPLIIGDEKKEGMESPFYQTGDETWAPSGIAMNENNEMFIACLRGEKVIKLSTDTKEVETIFDEGFRTRDVFLDNNFLYLITSDEEDRFIRLKIIQ